MCLFRFVVLLSFAFIVVPTAQGWSKEGHALTCQIAEVWDREIILTALADYYHKDAGLLLQDLQRNLTHGIWSDDAPTWEHCDDLDSCINKWAAESIGIACKWGYGGAEAGTTLAEDYFDSRMPIVMKRIAEGGVRLAMLLNRVFSEHVDRGFASPTYI